MTIIASLPSAFSITVLANCWRATCAAAAVSCAVSVRSWTSVSYGAWRSSRRLCRRGESMTASARHPPDAPSRRRRCGPGARILRRAAAAVQALRALRNAVADTLLRGRYVGVNAQRGKHAAPERSARWCPEFQRLPFAPVAAKNPATAGAGDDALHQAL